MKDYALRCPCGSTKFKRVETHTTASEGYVIGIDDMGFGLHRACYYKFAYAASEAKEHVFCAYCGRPINMAPGSDDYADGMLVEATDEDRKKDPKQNGKITTREQVAALYEVLNDVSSLTECEIDALMGYLDGETDVKEVVGLLSDAYVNEFASLQEAVWDILETTTDEMDDEARLELLEDSDEVAYVLNMPDKPVAIVYHA